MLGCPLMEIKSILEILEIFFIKKNEKKKKRESCKGALFGKYG